MATKKQGSKANPKPATTAATKKAPAAPKKMVGASSNNPCIPEPKNKKIQVVKSDGTKQTFETIIDAARELKMTPYTVKVYLTGKVRAPRGLKLSYV